MKEAKSKHTVWLSETAWNKVENHYHGDNCSTKNEYIEKAIEFYSGYLEAAGDSVYLPRVLSNILEGKLKMFGDRLGRLLFKLAVNDGMLTFLTAAGMNVATETLDRLRVDCVNDVKQTHGIIEFQDAYRETWES